MNRKGIISAKCLKCGITYTIELEDFETQPFVNQIQVCAMNDISNGVINCALCNSSYKDRKFK